MIPSTASPMFFFYTNILGFNPEFMGQLRVINAVASVGAILFYRIFLKLVKFKNIFFWTAILCMISQLLLLILITRYNIVLGINDKVFSICDSLFIHMMAELNMIPVLVFACRICPKNVEGTMYALVMSTLNLGGLLSEQTGALVVYLLGITSSEFGNLWILIVIVNVFILLLLPFLYFLNINEAQEIAEGKNDDTGVEEEQELVGDGQQKTILGEEEEKEKLNNPKNEEVGEGEEKEGEKKTI